MRRSLIEWQLQEPKPWFSPHPEYGFWVQPPQGQNMLISANLSPPFEVFITGNHACHILELHKHQTKAKPGLLADHSSNFRVITFLDAPALPEHFGCGPAHCLWGWFEGLSLRLSYPLSCINKMAKLAENLQISTIFLF